MSLFDLHLAELAGAFPQHRATIVLDDEPLRRYCMAWNPMLVRRRTDWPDGDTLADLWACVEVDTAALAELTGDSVQQVAARLRQAQGLQLILPDGSIAYPVRRVLEKRYRLAAESD